MKLSAVDGELRSRIATDIPELVWATGPSSYEYHFANRDLFDSIVLESWRLPGTLFAADATMAAFENGELAGIEIGMAGNDYRVYQNALGAIWQGLLADGKTNEREIGGVLERSEAASWLNPVIEADTYYIHALSVKPEFRGKRVGYLLIEDAIKRARAEGFAKLQLDVLSDNPAVGFYRAVGLELLAETTAPKPAAAGVPPEYRMGMKLI